MGSRHDSAPLRIRQSNREDCAVFRPAAVGVQPAAVQVDDPLGDRKTEPRRGLAAGGFCGQALETAEKARQVLGREARAAVANADDGLASGARQSDRDRALWRSVFDSVADEIVDSVAQAIRVACGDEAL